MTGITHQEFDTDVLIIDGGMAGCNVATAVTRADPVISAKAGIEEKPGFRVKPGMTEFISLMPSYIKRYIRSAVIPIRRTGRSWQKNIVRMYKYDENIFGGLEWK